MSNKETEVKQEKAESVSKINIPKKYTKAQILASERYANRRDILAVILKDDKEYSFDEITALLDKFMKGKVN